MYIIYVYIILLLIFSIAHMGGIKAVYKAIHFYGVGFRQYSISIVSDVPECVVTD